MLNRQKLNSQIDKLQERALRKDYQDDTSSFTELLEKDNSTTIHKRSIQLLIIELFKLKNGSLPSFMKGIFVENAKHYNLRKNPNLTNP